MIILHSIVVGSCQIVYSIFYNIISKFETQPVFNVTLSMKTRLMRVQTVFPLISLFHMYISVDCVYKVQNGRTVFPAEYRLWSDATQNAQRLVRARLLALH